MKITDKINNRKSTLFSFEILPPLKGQNIQSLFDTLESLLPYEPAFIDVTYHREDYLYRELSNGLLEKHVVRKRPGTVGICAAIANRYKIDTVPHIICGGFTRQETEDALIDLNYLGIDNVLLLRGDSMKSETAFQPEIHGHAYASQLVDQVNKMNAGQYIDPELRNAQPTSFCIGVAGYPEKHFEAPNMASDLRYLKTKVDLGADYIVTQMFFDNRSFFDFQKKCTELGITVPIIPGIKPLTSKKQLTTIPQNFYVNLPDELVQEIQKAQSDQQIKQIGIEWCISQCNELIKSGVPVLHFYSMGKSDTIATIAKRVF